MSSLASFSPLPSDAMSWHGFLGSTESWPPPELTFKSHHPARPGYASIDASEYRDNPSVLLSKVHMLAELIKASNNFLVYSGAGISTNSGIGDYARKSGTRVVDLMGKRINIFSFIIRT